jgi:Astacin (Peptidase family M12A)
MLAIAGLVGCGGGNPTPVEPPSYSLANQPGFDSVPTTKIALAGANPALDPGQSGQLIGKIIDGYAIVEGDINIGEVKQDSQGNYVVSGDPLDGLQGQSATTIFKNYWPKNTVVYDFDANLPQQKRSEFQTAIDKIVAKTHLRFVRRSNESIFVTIKQGNSCSSPVGRTNNGVITIHPNAYCGVSGMIHEIGHTLGLWHEHQRKDRDGWINIKRYPSFSEDDWQANFGSNYVQDSGPYDLSSIMHYRGGRYNGFEIVATNPANNVILNAAVSDLSSGDVASINRIYVPDAPSLTGPATQISNTTTQIVWQTVPGVSQYAVSVTDLTTKISLKSETTTATSLTLDQLQDQHRYGYSVQSISKDGGSRSLASNGEFVVQIPAAISAIAVQSANTTVSSGQVVNLTATVSGTGSFNSGINWSIVSGSGSLSSTTGSPVTYTAPNVITATTAKIRATSAGDSSKTADVTLTISVPTAISSVTANANASQLLGTQSATLSGTVNGTGTFNSNLTWSILSGGGSLSASSGSSVSYTAADITSNVTAIIRATSVGDASKTSDITIQVSPRSVVTGVSVTGNMSLASGAATTLFASVSGSGSYSSNVNWSVVSGGGSVSSSTGTSVTYTAPILGSNSTAVIRAISAQDASKSGSVSISVAGLVLPDQVCDVNWRPTGDFDVWRDDNAGGLNLGAHTENGGGMQYWWQDSSSGSGGNTWFTHANGRDDRPENYAYWAFNVPTSGNYAVYAFIPSANSVNGYAGDYAGLGYVDWRYREPAANVKYQFGTGPESENQGATRLNQNNNRGCWAKVGTVNYSGGTSYYVTIQDLVGAAGGYGGKIYYDVLALKRIP